MQWTSKLTANEMKSFLRCLIAGVDESPEQEYSYGFVLQKIQPSMKITKEQTKAELNSLLNAVSQFKEEEVIGFEIKLPIFSQSEDDTLAFVNKKYDAIKALTPKPSTLVKV